MRDTKFRAWVKPIQIFANRQYGYMIDVSLINFDEEWVSDDEGTVYDFHEIIIMQYTGRKDINGVEIYEGDTVNNGQHTYLVCFGEFTDSDDFQEPALSQTGFYIADKHTDETFPFYSMMYEVTGNIWADGESLED